MSDFSMSAEIFTAVWNINFRIPNQVENKNLPDILFLLVQNKENIFVYPASTENEKKAKVFYSYQCSRHNNFKFYFY